MEYLTMGGWFGLVGCVIALLVILLFVYRLGRAKGLQAGMDMLIGVFGVALAATAHGMAKAQIELCDECFADDEADEDEGEDNAGKGS